MATLLGPVLQFLGVQNKQWCISILLVTDTATPPALQSAVNTEPFKRLATLQSGATVWRGGLSVPMGTSARRVSYSVDAQSNVFYVPADGAPLCMAYSSCNGFSSPNLVKTVADQNALWKRLMNLHTGRERINGRSFGPYHLLLHGGD